MSSKDIPIYSYASAIKCVSDLTTTREWSNIITNTPCAEKRLEICEFVLGLSEAMILQMRKKLVRVITEHTRMYAEQSTPKVPEAIFLPALCMLDGTEQKIYLESAADVQEQQRKLQWYKKAYDMHHEKEYVPCPDEKTDAMSARMLAHAYAFNQEVEYRLEIQRFHDLGIFDESISSEEINKFHVQPFDLYPQKVRSSDIQIFKPVGHHG